MLLGLLAGAPLRAEQAIGRLGVQDPDLSGHCTASLIAPDLALTAAHCVTKLRDGALDRLTGMSFAAGWDGARHSGAARIAEVRLHPKAHTGSRQLNVFHDVAVIRLDRALEIAPLAVGRGVAGGPLTFMGYRRQRPDQLTVEADCPSEAGPLWRLGCPARSGQSGSPVFQGEGTSRRIVALVVAVNGADSLAVPLDQWVLRQLAPGR